MNHKSRRYHAEILLRSYHGSASVAQPRLLLQLSLFCHSFFTGAGMYGVSMRQLRSIWFRLENGISRLRIGEHDETDRTLDMGKWTKTQIRNLVGFWLLGLCNNYGYVIMLSAAEDIMNQQQHIEADNSTSICQEQVTDRHCSAASTGAVLVADNMPALIIQATFPFFMHRIPFGIRHALVCTLQIACYFIVAFSINVPMSLAGVTFASFAQGIGEITYLAMSSFFPPSAVAAWSSGTGGAGVLGSFAYALLTEAGLSPKTTLLIMLFIPGVFAVTYWLILDIPDTVYTPTINPMTWIVPANYYKNSSHENKSVERSTDSDTTTYDEIYSETKSEKSIDVEKEEEAQRNLSFMEKLKLIRPMLHLMIPLTLVYLTEYLINQGLTQLIFFNCSEGWHLSVSSQYRWYQVLYQVGVFISRSSVKFLTLPIWAIYLLPVLQTANMVFFIFESIYWFVPNIGIIFAIIVLEGLLGGGAYVNTYSYAHRTVSPDIREYSMSVIAFGVSVGTTIAGFVAIPLHNFVCDQPTPHI